jgi:hypothetical protein
MSVCYELSVQLLQPGGNTRHPVLMRLETGRVAKPPAQFVIVQQLQQERR